MAANRSTKFITFALSLALVLATLISSFGFAVSPAQAGACTQYHTVKRGEYLSQIAGLYDLEWRDLAELNELDNPSKIYPGQKLCISTSDVIIPDTGADDEDADTPNIEIVKVRRNDDVAIIVSDFPAKVKVDVLMDEAGTKGEDGIRVATVTTDSFGEIEETFDIPSSLRNDARIVIRVEAVRSNHFAYATFDNKNFEKPAQGHVDPDLDDESAEVVVQRVRFERAEDVFIGNMGMFMPKSNYTAWLQLTRYEKNNSVAQQGLSFVRDLIDVRMLDEDEDEIERVFGLNYLYFNLNRQTRNLYDDGDLDIYFYNPEERQWEPCEFQYLIKTKNGPYGRLSCVITDFGLYGLAQH
jgi:hypothetical protein